MVVETGVRLLSPASTEFILFVTDNRPSTLPDNLVLNNHFEMLLDLINNQCFILASFPRII
nr:MAG TPA: hypothetical protein [Caudoviricetes sp.]